MFQHSNAFPQACAAAPRQMAAPVKAMRRSPTLSRRELRRLIADMID